MEKFSLYDFLGLLLPGVLFVYFGTVLNMLFNVCPLLVAANGSNFSIGILLCLALITGAMLYAINFWLVAKPKWYNRLFGMYKHVADLFLEMGPLPKQMNNTLNQKAKEWYSEEIFFTNSDFENLNLSRQKQVKDNQEEYYDRMYYELEYVNKIEHPKTFQSFYFFFRQIVTACLLLIAIIGILQFASLVPFFGLNQPQVKNTIWLVACLSITLILSAQLARWYRKRTIMKMYWAYFTHLTLNK